MHILEVFRIIRPGNNSSNLFIVNAVSKKEEKKRAYHFFFLVICSRTRSLSEHFLCARTLLCFYHYFYYFPRIWNSYKYMNKAYMQFHWRIVAVGVIAERSKCRRGKRIRTRKNIQQKKGTEAMYILDFSCTFTNSTTLLFCDMLTLLAFSRCCVSVFILFCFHLILLFHCFMCFNFYFFAMFTL